MSKLKKTVKEAKKAAAKTIKTKKKKKKSDRVSFYRKPEEMSLEEWQSKLRWQFGETALFAYSNKGEQPVFSDFEVKNIEGGQTYTVSIRMPEEGGHTCTCMDFKTNRLGVCKHIGFMFTVLEKKR